ncbi:hypothetical protein OAV88_03360 [bacterium]|nr:hypothetical protein [bacterium]
MVISQEFAAVELFGVEGKNRYRVTTSSADPKDTSPHGQQLFYMNEVCLLPPPPSSSLSLCLSHPHQHTHTHTHM